MVPSTISFFPSIINYKRPAKTPLMEQDAFFYFGEEGIVENLTKYRRGGLHPVHLGDVLPKPGTCKSDGAIRPLDRISQKLGFGAFSIRYICCPMGGLGHPGPERQTSGPLAASYVLLYCHNC